MSVAAAAMSGSQQASGGKRSKEPSPITITEGMLEKLLETGSMIQVLVVGRRLSYSKVLVRFQEIIAEAFERPADEILAEAEEAGTTDSAVVTRIHEYFGMVTPEQALKQRFGLTSREAEILELLTGGLSNCQIGKQLFIAEQTVKFHMTSVFRKLGVDNRTKAAGVYQQFMRDAV